MLKRVSVGRRIANLRHRLAFDLLTLTLSLLGLGDARLAGDLTTPGSRTSATASTGTTTSCAATATAATSASTTSLREFFSGRGISI